MIQTVSDHILWVPPYGDYYIRVEQIERLLVAGIIVRVTDLWNDPAIPPESAKWLALKEEQAQVLYHLGNGFDKRDFDLACQTLYQRDKADKARRVLDALG
jgi:hypothetical protein